jgi:hypothetical protein
MGGDDDLAAIGRLQAAYGDVVTRRAWDELPALFVADCPVRLDLRGGRTRELAGPEELATFVAASLERFDFFAFGLLNAVASVTEPGRTATGRMYIQELRLERGVGWTTAVGLYRDDYRMSEGAWRFARRAYATLARTVSADVQAEAFPVPSG